MYAAERLFLDDKTRRIYLLAKRNCAALLENSLELSSLSPSSLASMAVLPTRRDFSDAFSFDVSTPTRNSDD